MAEEELKARGVTLRERGKNFVPWRKEEPWMEEAESDREGEEDIGYTQLETKFQNLE